MTTQPPSFSPQSRRNRPAHPDAQPPTAYPPETITDAATELPTQPAPTSPRAPQQVRSLTQRGFTPARPQAAPQRTPHEEASPSPLAPQRRSVMPPEAQARGQAQPRGRATAGGRAQTRGQAQPQARGQAQPQARSQARPQAAAPAPTSYPGDRPPPAYAPAHMRQRASQQRSGAAGAGPTRAPGAAGTASASGHSAPAGLFPPTRSAERPAASPRYSAPPPSGPSPRPARRRRRHPIRWFILLLIAAIIAWPTFLYVDANNNLRRVDALSSAAGTPGTTWLLAGSDSRADGPIQDNTEGERADTIMLVHQAENGQASAISLPRDTWVEIPGHGWDKLNAAYALEGPSLLVESVEHLTGLTVDHYVEIGMGGVGSIVDAVGGVELCLDMDVNDPLSELVWESGCHVSDGKTALAFARMRYADPLGDIGRAERQRQVVTKTVKKALAPSTLLWPPSALALERAGSQALRVDNDASALAVGRMVLAFRQAGSDGITGAPPIASLNYETEAGSAVLLVDDTAPEFFESLRQGTLTPEDLKQDLL